MKFTDGKGLLEVHLYDAHNKSGVERTEDFYDNAPQPDNDGTCHVSNVRTFLNRALDMLHRSAVRVPLPLAEGRTSKNE